MAMALFLAGGAVVAGLSGCGTSSGSLCNKVCDCTGCSENEKEECVDALDDTRKAAEDEGCSDQHGAYFACIDGELTCNDGTIDADGCESEGKELGKCLGGLSVIGFSVGGDNVGACKAYFAHVNSLTCIGDVTLDDTECDQYEDTNCNYTDYFDCVSSHYVCDGDMLDSAEAAQIDECSALADCQ